MESTRSEVAREQSNDDGSKEFARRAMEEVDSCRALRGSLGGSIHTDNNGQRQVSCQVIDSSGEIRNVLPPLTISSDGRPPREGHGRF